MDAVRFDHFRRTFHFLLELRKIPDKVVQLLQVVAIVPAILAGEEAVEFLAFWSERGVYPCFQPA